jgi:hypothetical protein
MYFICYDTLKYTYYLTYYISNIKYFPKTWLRQRNLVNEPDV